MISVYPLGSPLPQPCARALRQEWASHSSLESGMTKLFQRAIGKVSQLPDAEQDAIARLVLDEIESDRRWSDLVAKSPDALADLGDKAWAEHEAGGSEELDPEKP